MAEFIVKPEDYLEGGRLWNKPNIIVVAPEGTRPIIDEETGVAYTPGSRAIEVTQTGQGFESLPENLKNLIGPSAGNYNPFQTAQGYAFDKTTGQLIVQTAPGSFSTLGGNFTTDASGKIIRNLGSKSSTESESATDAAAAEAAAKAAAEAAAAAAANNLTGYTGSGITGDPLKFNGVPFTGSYLGQNFVGGISEVASAAKAERQSAYDALLIEFNKYGLGSLVERVKGLIEKNVAPSQFVIELRNTPEYQQRFSANQERLKRGLAALSEAEYIRTEDNYRQILRTYGLTRFDNDNYVKQFLVNDVSPQELGERVITAVNRVQNADRAITDTLRRYYGLQDSDMVAAILDPTAELPKIQRQITAAEIGTAAGRQGINAGRLVSEQLAAQGVTREQAERGYATIAEVLPTAEKLSNIYAGMEESYRLPEAEQEVFNQLASAQRKRQRLAQREIASFSGASGLGRTSLTEETRGQF